MGPNGKAVGLGAVIGGWEDPVRQIIEWIIHGMATNQWGVFPEVATSSLIMAVFSALVYRTWAQSVRTPPEPKA